jgi:geranyl-CoA carboxylase alpha subunit
MGAVAVEAVKRLSYEGAGTLEFLLDQHGAFYFMEMNTRLQVEHPVTEAITGLDLVELQLRVARGEPLDLRQEDIKFAGHAIEVRLCSEDANRDFMPQSGTMARWQMPDGIRVEHALRSGSEIPPFYDSMIAKLVSHGATREEARAGLICALEQTIALGVTTNQAFLMSCLRHPAFARGEATTAFIERYRVELQAKEPSGTDVALAGLLFHVSSPYAPSWRGERTLAANFAIPARLELDGGVHGFDLIREREGGYIVVIDGAEYRFEIEEVGDGEVRFRADGVMQRVKFLRAHGHLYFQHRGIPHSVRDLTLVAPQTAASGGGDGKVRAALNGRVVAVLVKPGEHVSVGQPVMTLEAMKMEHVHRAGIAGTVASIDIAEGEQVTTGRIVVEIAAA